MKFSDLGLAKPVLKALEQNGYETPTPIQGKAIPSILQGTDLLGIAQTGTGKTAAFALPILTRLAENKAAPKPKTARALVLSPTRELATQIADNFKKYGQYLGFRTVVVFGGVSSYHQKKILARGVDILVATPGRLLDHVGERNINLNDTGIFVLDEADQMLDMGFVQPIRKVVAELPKERQSLFFSATMPKQIQKLASELLTDPEHVAVAPVSSTAERVDQKVILIERAKKASLLADLLKAPEIDRAVVFVRTKRGADRVTRFLDKADIKCAAIHGAKSQSQRESALKAFRKSKINVLVATDIAARGIDIDDVSHVINHDLPEVAEAYVHRIGRTARAGKSGSAISLCDTEELGLLRAIERLTKQDIEKDDRRDPDAIVEGAEETKPPVRRRQRRGGPSRNGAGRPGTDRGANRGGSRGAGRGKDAGSEENNRRKPTKRKKAAHGQQGEKQSASRPKRKPFKSRGKNPANANGGNRRRSDNNNNKRQHAAQ